MPDRRSTRNTARGQFRFSGWKLDRRTRRLTDSTGAPVALTKGEYALSSPSSMRHSGRSAGGTTRVHEDVFDRSIDVRILRRRLERGPSARAPRVIQTERGIGYVFADPVERV